MSPSLTGRRSFLPLDTGAFAGLRVQGPATNERAAANSNNPGRARMPIIRSSYKWFGVYARQLFHHRPPAARVVDAQRLDLVVDDTRADVQQFRGVLLHPVRHLQRFDERLALDVLERDAGRRQLDDRCESPDAASSTLRRGADRRR